MKSPLFADYLKMYCVFGLFVLLALSYALAQGDQATTLTITPLGAQPLGRSIGVRLKLADTAGSLIPHQRVTLFLHGKALGHTYTSSEGHAKLRFDTALSAGDYLLEAHFVGTKAYRASEAATTLTLEPFVFTVQTVPPLAGVKLEIGSYAFTTDANGSARVEVGQRGVYPLRVYPWERGLSRAGFARWGDGVLEDERSIDISRHRTLEVGFDVEQRIKPTFADHEGTTISGARISELTFKNSYGNTVSLRGDQAAWLRANRIIRRGSGLEAKRITYTLERVLIDGSNVVNRGQQRFSPQRGRVWQLRLLLYHLQLEAIDAVLGTPIGKGVNLEYPNGRREQLTFDPSGKMKVGPLARGLYQAQVVGAQGVAPPTPIALSRDQAVTLKVLSRLDIVVGVTLGLVTALSLLLLGRLGTVRRLLKQQKVTLGAWDDMSSAPVQVAYRPYKRR